MKFKVGDKVRCHYNDNGSGHYVGEVGEITCTTAGSSRHPYNTSFACGSTFGDHELELINDNPVDNMNLLERAKLAVKGEPEKSFIKAGVMDINESLTNEGRELWTLWLVRKFGADFKKEVVDGLLAEMEAEKKN